MPITLPEDVDFESAAFTTLGAIALPTDSSSAVTRELYASLFQDKLYGKGDYHPPARGQRLAARVTSLPAAILAGGFGLGGGTFTLDAAVQRNEDIDLEAWAGRVTAEYTFSEMPWSPSVTVGYQTFSGDDPGALFSLSSFMVNGFLKKSATRRICKPFDFQSDLLPFERSADESISNFLIL